MKEYLITKDDVKNVRNFATSITDTKVNPFILDTQNLDIKPAIGDGLFIELLTGLDAVSVEAKYSNLYNGCDYTITGSTIKYRHSGLKMAACLYTYARILEGSEFTLNQFGAVVKTSQYSEQTDKASLSRAITSARSAAVGYLNETIAFIKNNITDYPVFCDYFKVVKKESNYKIIGQ